MDEEEEKDWLEKVLYSHYTKAERRFTYKPKNLQSTGHPFLIKHADPNPKAISNKPKKRFSKEQREYLKSVYYDYVVYGKLERREARHAFNVRSIYQEDSKLEIGDKVQDLKAAYRSSKRSAKNLAEYGFAVLSYDFPKEYEWEDDPFQNRGNLAQPALFITPTIAAVEKGKEFRERDGETTDPDELRRRLKQSSEAWRKTIQGFKNS